MPSRPLRLETDAAQSKGLGMALWQQQPSGDWRLLQCGYCHVTAAESRYSTTEVELLAKKAHLYLAGSDFETPCRPPATHPTTRCRHHD